MAEEYEHMLKTQGTWRPFNLSGEPVTETEDPHKTPPNLATPAYVRPSLAPFARTWLKNKTFPSQVVV